MQHQRAERAKWIVNAAAGVVVLALLYQCYHALFVARFLGRGAQLRGVNLEAASLGGVDLRKADLRGARLGAAELSGARLAGADLREADLREARLARADLSGARLGGADLRSADLTDTDLTRADLSGTLLSRATLERARLVESRFGLWNLAQRRAEPPEAWLPDGRYRSVRLDGANQRYANLRGAVLAYGQLGGADLSHADLHRAALPFTDLGKAILDDVAAGCSSACGGSARPGAPLGDAAGLHFAFLERARLRGADLNGADLTHTKLAAADLTGANLQRANLEDAVFHCCHEVNYPVMRGTRYDRRTRWPAGFDAREYGAVQVTRQQAEAGQAQALHLPGSRRGYLWTFALYFIPAPIMCGAFSTALMRVGGPVTFGS